MILDQLNDDSILCRIPNHALVRVWGKDAESFLQGQLANDVLQLGEGRSQLNCRLTLQGKIQGFFSLGRLESQFYIFIANFWVSPLIDELGRYLIMEDVQFEVLQEGEFLVRTGALALSTGQVPVHYMGFQGHIEDNPGSHSTYSPQELKQAIVYSGYPIWEKSVEERDFVNETIIGQYGISYEKGCFYGQEETPAKINAGRGGNYFPCLIQVDGSSEMNEIESADIVVEGKQVGRVIDYLPQGKYHILQAQAFASNFGTRVNI